MSRVDRTRLPTLGPDPEFRFPRIEKSSFGSGGSIWTVERRALPVLSCTLLLPRGFGADPPDRPGLAALTADLLDEGCGTRSMVEVHETIDAMGAAFDVDVGPDATILTFTALSRFADDALDLMGDMIARPWLADTDFERVRDLRRSRLLQLRDAPSAVADRIFTETLYGGHPYGHVPIGTEAALARMTPEDVRAFHGTHHGASGSTLIAVGDASHADLVRAAARAFAGWSGGGPPGETPSGAPPTPSERLVIAHRPRAAQSELRIGHVALARDTPDYHALVVLNMILGGQFVSRINRNLREEKGYTYGARTWFDFRRGPGPFCTATSVATDATAAAIREVFNEIGAIRDDRPATPHEIERARAALTRGYPRGFETADQIARAAAQLALYGLPDDYFDRFASRIAAVDAAEVARVAREHLEPARLATVVVGDRERIGASLADLALGAPVEVAIA
jgi:predicted Zn-dependent peptidase